MARPRLGQSETKRLQMVITEDELAAIDQWRFANHVGSRSDAIRRLCQIGMDMHWQATLSGRRAWELTEEVQARTAKASSEEEAAFYNEIFGLLIDVAVSSGRALQYGGKGILEKLLQNDAELRRMIEEDDKESSE